MLMVFICSGHLGGSAQILENKIRVAQGQESYIVSDVREGSEKMEKKFVELSLRRKLTFSIKEFSCLAMT